MADVDAWPLACRICHSYKKGEETLNSQRGFTICKCRCIGDVCPDMAHKCGFNIVEDGRRSLALGPTRTAQRRSIECKCRSVEERCSEMASICGSSIGKWTENVGPSPLQYAVA